MSMRGVQIALAAASLLAASVAYADDTSKSFECRSIETNATPITIQCRVVDGRLVEESCNCPANFVLIDTGSQPAAGPGPNPPSNG